MSRKDIHHCLKVGTAGQRHGASCTQRAWTNGAAITHHEDLISLVAVSSGSDLASDEPVVSSDLAAGQPVVSSELAAGQPVASSDLALAPTTETEETPRPTKAARTRSYRTPQWVKELVHRPSVREAWAASPAMGSGGPIEATPGAASSADSDRVTLALGDSQAADTPKSDQAEDSQFW